jgi:HlyD family secretion protein
LHNQKVDIGDQVKQGQVLAEIDAPLLRKEEEQAALALEGAKSQLHFSEALVLAAEADVNTAKTMVEQRKAELVRAVATLEFRHKRYERLKQLADSGAVNKEALDEQYEQFEAARGARDLARAGIATAESEVRGK